MTFIKGLFAVVLHTPAVLGAVVFFGFILLFFIHWMNPDYSVGVVLLKRGVVIIDYYNRHPIQDFRTEADFRFHLGFNEIELTIAWDFIPLAYEDDAIVNNDQCRSEA